MDTMRIQNRPESRWEPPPTVPCVAGNVLFWGGMAAMMVVGAVKLSQAQTPHARHVARVMTGVGGAFIATLPVSLVCIAFWAHVTTQWQKAEDHEREQIRAERLRRLAQSQLQLESQPVPPSVLYGAAMFRDQEMW
jgi:hypothetical protein